MEFLNLTTAASHDVINPKDHAALNPKEPVLRSSPPSFGEVRGPARRCAALACLRAPD
jgi:hypothetical protein